MGQYIQVSPISNFCSYKVNTYTNQYILDNIRLSEKQKKIFERKILRNKLRKTHSIKKSLYNARNLLNIGRNNETLALTSLSVTSKLFINEIDYSPKKKYKVISNIGQGS